MTRKDYRAIATALRTAFVSTPRSDAADQAFALVVLNISNALERDNPRFDRDRFSAAVYEGVR